jgi:hypothetical protein
VSFHAPLPTALRGADWSRYAGTALPRSWEGFCRAWFDVGYVWLQALEREADAAEL